MFFPPKFLHITYLYIYIYDFISCRRSMGSKLDVPSLAKCDPYLIANSMQNENSIYELEITSEFLIPWQCFSGFVEKWLLFVR